MTHPAPLDTPAFPTLETTTAKPWTGERYRWWPAYVDPKQVAALGAPESFWKDAIACWIVALPFLIPAVVHTTGITFARACIVPGGFTVWLFTTALLQRLRSRALSFHLVVAGNLVVNTCLALAFPLLSGDPRTPLWGFVTVYACINAAGPELGLSRVVLGVHVALTLATIFLFRLQGCDPIWSVAAPLLSVAMTVTGYHVIGTHTAVFHKLRLERDRAAARVRELELERQNRHLARELHDSVGSALTLAAMYGDIFERASASGDVSRLAAGLRESARTALDDLRGVLGAVAPAASTIGALAQSFREVASRVEQASGATLSVTVEGSSDSTVDGPTRLSLMRVFQEATHNALRHGAATAIAISIVVTDAELRLSVNDNGKGMADQTTPGRGISGMRQRATDLGGALVIGASASGGTNVTLALPVLTIAMPPHAPALNSKTA